MKLNYIVNENENLGNKMKYFADYFNYVNEFIGRIPEIPFENPLSLVDKTLFQIENNFERCTDYITDYLSQLLCFWKNTEYTLTTFSADFRKKINAYKIEKDKKSWLKRNQDFISDLHRIKADFETNLFEKCFSTLQVYITCNHPLKKHKIAIQEIASILVSMFRFNGHTKDSIATYIGRIISNNKYEFPFPPSIYEIKQESEYQKTVSDFLETRDFMKQFEGLKNIYVTDKHRKAYFFYVIDNFFIDKTVEKDFEVSFDKVTFITTSHKRLRKLRRSVKEDDKKTKMKMFSIFFGKHKMLAYIEMGYERKDTKKNDGLKIVSEEIVFLNQFIDKSLTVNSLHYLVYDSFESELWTATRSFSEIDKRPISNFLLEDAKNNPFQILRNVNSPSKPIILQSENVFLKAFARNEVEYFWVFLENLFAPLFNDNKEIRKNFSKLLLRVVPDLKDIFFTEIGLIFTPFNFNLKNENLTLEEVTFIYSTVFVNHNYEFDLNQYKSKVESIVLKDMIDYHSTSYIEQNKGKWKIYFDSLLTDLYAYRNALLHTGTTDSYSKIKFSYILPKLFSRARWLLINTCIKNPNFTYDELINLLTA